MKYFISYCNIYGFKEETASSFEADDNANRNEVIWKAMELIEDYEKTLISQSFIASIDDMMEVFDGDSIRLVVESDDGEVILRHKSYLPFTIDLEKDRLWFRGTSIGSGFDIPDTSMSVSEIMSQYKGA